MPSIVPPIARPRSKVVTLAISLRAAPARRSTTPDSRSKFPSMSVAINGEACGESSETTSVTAIGKITRAVFETSRCVYGMRTLRSLSVVIKRMTGGWMIGTSDM